MNFHVFSIMSMLVELMEKASLLEILSTHLATSFISPGIISIFTATAKIYFIPDAVLLIYYLTHLNSY